MTNVDTLKISRVIRDEIGHCNYYYSIRPTRGSNNRYAIIRRINNIVSRTVPAVIVVHVKISVFYYYYYCCCYRICGYRRVKTAATGNFNAIPPNGRQSRGIA